jgi:hypothetical protein
LGQEKNEDQPDRRRKCTRGGRGRHRSPYSPICDSEVKQHESERLGRRFTPLQDPRGRPAWSRSRASREIFSATTSCGRRPVPVVPHVRPPRVPSMPSISARFSRVSAFIKRREETKPGNESRRIRPVDGPLKGALRAADDAPGTGFHGHFRADFRAVPSQACSSISVSR